MTKAFDISKVRNTLNTQIFASLSGASFYNAETQENSKNVKVEDYDSAMTGVEGDVVLHRLVLPAVKVTRQTDKLVIWRAEDGGGGLCGLAHVSLFSCPGQLNR